MYITLNEVANFTSTAGQSSAINTAPILQIKHLANTVPHDLSTDPVIYIDHTQTLHLALINSINAKQSLPHPMPVGFIPITGSNGIHGNDGTYDATNWGYESGVASIDPDDFNVFCHDRRSRRRNV